MNTPHDTHSANDSRPPVDADALLDERVRAYFTQRPIEPLAMDAFWQRLAITAERQEQSDKNAGSAIPAPTQTTAQVAPTVAEMRPIARPNATGARRVIGNLLGLAAALALCLAAFALFHQQGSETPGVAQTIQRGELHWQKVALPAGVVLTDGEGVRITTGGGTPVDTGQPTTWPAANATLQVAPSNGAIAYICQITKSGAARVWRTTDAGQSWSLLPPLPGANAYNACGVAIDANDPNTVVVGIGDQATGAQGAYALFAGATQWKPLPQAPGQFTSWGEVYYRVGNVVDKPGESAAEERIYHLYVSTDQLQTWQEITAAPLITENLASAKITKWNGVLGVSEVWVQPKTGELLAQTYDGVLWRSIDHAQHWTRIILPALPPVAELTPTPGETEWQGGPTAAIAFVQQPVASKPFTLCVMVLDQQPIDYNVAPLYCSDNSGQSWTRRPRTAIDEENGRPSTFALPNTMLSDGELLAWNVQVIVIYPGANISAPAAHVIGTIPPPRDANNIPGGQVGITSTGVTLWQPWDPQTLYVATYTTPASR